MINNKENFKYTKIYIFISCIFFLSAWHTISSQCTNAYVTNSYSDNVSVINLATNLVETTIDVGDEPTGVIVSPTGDFVYVTNRYSNNVSVINTTTNLVETTITVGDEPAGIGISPNGNFIYVVNRSSLNVYVINTATNLRESIIEVGTGPFGICVSPDGDFAYVTNTISDNVSVINITTNTVIATITVGNEPNGISISPNGDFVYVTNIYSHNISVINTATNLVETSIDVGQFPGAVAISPDGNFAYVTNIGSDDLYVINTGLNSIDNIIQVGDNPIGLSVRPNGAYVYVSNLNSNTVSVINTATYELETTINVGNGPISFGNIFCTNFNVTEPEIAIKDYSINCNNNSTPVLVDDDFYDVSITSSVINGGLSGQYEVVVDGIIVDTSDYDMEASFSLPADGDNFFAFTRDIDDNSIKDSIEIGPLLPCSNTCEIMIDDLSVNCNNNRTPALGYDDFYDVSIMASAVNHGVSGSFDVVINDNTVATSDYSSEATFSIPADSSYHTVYIRDSDEQLCYDSMKVGPLLPCVSNVDLTLEAIEFNQVTQNLKNEIPLIEGKTTLVRAYLKSHTEEQQFLSGVTLDILDENDNVLKTLTPENSNGQNFPVPADPIGDRADIASTINFKIVGADLSLLSGTRKFSLNASGLACNEIVEEGGTPGDCAVEVEFRPSPGIITINYFLPTILGLDLRTHKATFETMIEEVEKMNSILPLADNSIKYKERKLYRFPRPFRFNDDEFKRMNEDIKDIQIGDLGSSALDRIDQQYLAFIEDYQDGILGSNPGRIYGQSSFMNSASVRVNDKSNNPFTTFAGAHELVHSFGFQHLPSCDAMVFTDQKCFEYRGTDCVMVNDPHLHEIDGISNIATISDLDANQESISYGYDSRRDLILSATTSDENVAFELMSYCGSQGFGNVRNVARWISDSTYVQVYRHLMNEYKNLSAPLVLEANVPTDYYLISGIINTATHEVELDSLTTFTSSLTQSNLPGDYDLILKDEMGNIIATIPFIANTGSEGGDYGHFVLTYPLDESIYKVQVSRDDVELAAIERSPNPPTVEITYPIGGESLTGNFTITWEGEDLDGDDLRYRVEISQDGGTTWDALMINYPETSLEVNNEYIGGSDQNLIRVQVTDGLNIDENVMVQSFTTANVPPVVLVYSPENNETFYDQQAMIFEAGYLDIDNNDEDIQVTWTSSRDGVIGTGATFPLISNELSRGMHTITVTFEDPDGGITTEFFSITIRRDVPGNIIPTLSNWCLIILYLLSAISGWIVIKSLQKRPKIIVATYN